MVCATRRFASTTASGESGSRRACRKRTARVRSSSSTTRVSDHGSPIARRANSVRSNSSSQCNTPTEAKLHSMRLGVMAETWQEQSRSDESRDLSFDERFGMIVDAEHLHRENRKLARLLRDARLRIPGASVDDIRASAARGLTQNQLSELRSERWILHRLRSQRNRHTKAKNERDAKLVGCRPFDGRGTPRL